MQTYFKVIGGLAVLGLVFMGLTAAVPANDLLCGPSNINLECGSAGVSNGLVMGGPLSGANNNDLFFMQNGTELLEIEDSGSNVSFNSASGAIILSDEVKITDLDNAVIAQSDLGATCTLGAWAYDTGATDELCYCFATDTWMCISATTIDGPTD